MFTFIQIMTGSVLYALCLCFLSTIIIMVLISVDVLSEHRFCHNVPFEALSKKIFNSIELNYTDKITLPIDYVNPKL